MKHVLIVEDDPMQQLYLQIIISKMGMLTSVCLDLFLILERVKRGLVDAITIDLSMPEISGIELIKHIRTIDNEIPLIVITAYANNEMRIDAMQAGASYYLVKPVSNIDLKSVLTNIKN